MKDYYYILGVPNTATEQEIKLAYKKLSVKFHPDKNDGDSFFEDRFKEVQEAFETLSNPLKRASYDALLDPKNARERLENIDTNLPLITVFECSKKLIYEGDLITIRWQTVHAQAVEIDFVGSVDLAGTKSIRLPALHNKPFIQISIQATNTFTNKKTEKQLKITNKSYNERQIHMLYQNEERPTMDGVVEVEKKEQSPTTPKPELLEEERTTENIEPIVLNTTSVKEKGAKDLVASNLDEEEDVFRKKDIFFYLLLIGLFAFITIISVYVYRMNPF